MDSIEKTAYDLLSSPGETKGEVFHNLADYIEKKEGVDGLKKIEEKMAELGAPVRLREIEPMKWESAGLAGLVIVLTKHTFNWTDEDIFQWGRSRTKVSFIVKTIAQTLVSLERLVKETPHVWKRNFNFGEAEVELKKEEKKIFLRLRNFYTHPVVCMFNAGYVKGMVELCLRSKDIRVEEIKCPNRGDDYHEYLVTWI